MAFLERRPVGMGSPTTTPLLPHLGSPLTLHEVNQVNQRSGFRVQGPSKIDRGQEIVKCWGSWGTGLLESEAY